MRASDFCYWLMGYFEIGGPGINYLDVQQIITIKVHLKLVEAHDPKNKIDFIKWLPKAFVLVDDNGCLAADAVKLIRDRLNAVFTHVIDPSHGPQEHQNLLNEIHEQSQPVKPWLFQPGPNGEMMRC